MKGVLGIGNAITDILAVVPDDTILNDLHYKKGSMQLVDYDTIEKIKNKINSFIHSTKSGGSVGNTIYGVASLNFPAAFIGKIGNDSIGNFYKKDMEEQGVDCFFSYSSKNSGLAIAIITPDSERTFATYLGAASELTPDNIIVEIFDKYQILHLEGYLVFNQELLLYVAQKAKEKNLKISFDLSSFNIVEENREFIKNFLCKYVDIVFANEEEARAFCGLDAFEAVKELNKCSQLAIVKMGNKGSVVKRNGDIHHIPAINANVVDTTGAGDWYAAGFLYGLCNNLDLIKSAQIATFLAGKVIEHIGAKIPQIVLPEIVRLAKKL
jgi:sugar/nucleoside kinase (ribokinase family)